MSLGQGRQSQQAHESDSDQLSHGRTPSAEPILGLRIAISPSFSRWRTMLRELMIALLSRRFDRYVSGERRNALLERLRRMSRSWKSSSACARRASPTTTSSWRHRHSC
jgi:hypothetical protein